ncbi:MAG: putative esterase [Flavobacteriales bacterium]|jgi:predicted esterase
MIEEKQLLIQKTARYFCSREMKSSEKEIVIVLHGYGQSAYHFLRKFKAISTDDRLVIAPEGLHRFYTQGFSGRVGASWMTKEARLSDIDDYVRFLDDLVHSLTMPDAKIVVIGFSQGAATAVRWICQGKSRVHKLVAWAGSFPSDLDFPNDASALNKTDLDLVIGNQDEFIKSDHIKDMQHLLEKQKIVAKTHHFEGGHDIHEETLITLFC